VAARILIVDGDADSRSVYGIMLQHQGYDVAEAEDGEVALRMLTAATTVVIMELTLRVVDGHVLLERLTAERPDVRVVVVTARALEGDRERAHRSGCAKYLMKPLEPQQLLREIEDILGGPGRE
jgi:CheY-like chemotaxis protein